MEAKFFCFQLLSDGAPQFNDVIGSAGECVEKSTVSNGFAVVYSKHTTAAVKINENEPHLIEAVSKFLEKTSPRDGGYQHDDFTIRTVNRTSDESPTAHRPRPPATPHTGHHGNRSHH